MSNLLERITAADDLTLSEPILVPEWNLDEPLYVRLFNGAERDDFEAFIASGGGEDTRGVRARLVALTLCDQSGQRVFPKVGDGIKILQRKSSAVLNRLAEAAYKHNAFDGDTVEELEKN
jgi:hypothetical protein